MRSELNFARYAAREQEPKDREVSESEQSESGYRSSGPGCLVCGGDDLGIFDVPRGLRE